METAPAREPHLVRFRVHAEESAPTPEADASPTVLGLARPVPPPDRPTLRDRLDRWRDDPRARIAAIALVALIAGLYWYRSALGGEAAPLEDAALDPPATSETPERTAPSEIVVHVSGAVARPGVLRLGSHSRVADAVEAAGGAVADADLDQLNLAALLGDGERVHVPLEGETLPTAVGANAAPAGPLNVNNASAAELETLPGIGPTIAQAIVAARADHRFETVDDLLRVRGIGPSKLEELRSLITV